MVGAAHAGKGTPLKLLDGVTSTGAGASFIFNRSYNETLTFFVDPTGATTFTLVIEGRIGDSAWAEIKQITQADISGGVFTEADLISFPAVRGNVTAISAGSIDAWVFN